MSYSRVFAALAAFSAALAAVFVVIAGSMRLEVGGELHSAINACVAAKAGSGLEGCPVASSEIVYARKTANGGVVYLWAQAQGYGGASAQPELLWSKSEAFRVSLKNNESTGEPEPDYCMLPREDENYESDTRLLFSPLVRARLGRLKKSAQLQASLESKNFALAAERLAESEKVSTYTVRFVSSEGAVAMAPLSLVKARGSLALTAAITNETGGVVCYGNEFTLEKQAGDGFERLPLREGYAFYKGMSVLEDGRQSDRLFTLNAYFDDIRPGTYRLTAAFSPATEEAAGEEITAAMVFRVE